MIGPAKRRLRETRSTIAGFGYVVLECGHRVFFSLPLSPQVTAHDTLLCVQCGAHGDGKLCDGRSALPEPVADA